MARQQHQNSCGGSALVEPFGNDFRTAFCGLSWYVRVGVEDGERSTQLVVEHCDGGFIRIEESKLRVLRVRVDFPRELRQILPTVDGREGRDGHYANRGDIRRVCPTETGQQVGAVLCFCCFVLCCCRFFFFFFCCLFFVVFVF